MGGAGIKRGEMPQTEEEIARMSSDAVLSLARSFFAA